MLYIYPTGQVLFSYFSSIVALLAMFHLKLLVIALSSLLSTCAALALQARNDPWLVEEIVDVIDDLRLFPFCAWYLHAPEFPHTSTSYIGTRTLVVSGSVTITDSITQTTSSGTTDVTDLTTDTTTITFTAASDTGIPIYHNTERETLLIKNSYRHHHRYPLHSVSRSLSFYLHSLISTNWFLLKLTYHTALLQPPSPPSLQPSILILPGYKLSGMHRLLVTATGLAMSCPQSYPKRRAVSSLQPALRPLLLGP
jgi:hypothetical protein